MRRVMTPGLIVLVARMIGVVRVTPALTTGMPAPPGLYDAVGRLAASTCSATLISPTQVLTAAHCVCREDRPEVCQSRDHFELFDVAPAADPATPVDEPATLGDLRTPGLPWSALRRRALTSQPRTLVACPTASGFSGGPAPRRLGKGAPSPGPVAGPVW